jgi:succinyl-CoA synthetase alpha subunit
MAVLIDSQTKVICQGFTGAQATYHMERAIAYGTEVVGGVVPGKGGRKHLGLPVFDTVAEAVAATGATASAVFVPPVNAAAAMLEAIEAELPLVVCVTERVPVLDMVRIKRALEDSPTRLIGPNSQGIIAPGLCKIGVMPAHLDRPGRIGIASRSASLTSEVVEQTTVERLGQTTSIGIGGDPVHGVGFVDCLELFLADSATAGIVLVGEIGGSDEEEAAAFIEAEKPKKPIVAYVAGLHAPTERRMGHAGTVNVFGRGDAAVKIEALRAAGARIANNAAEIGATMRQALIS